ncbi:unknown [Clostridium sp. CAG:715]|nr:unknown [Clostridium sp. CAG:715]
MELINLGENTHMCAALIMYDGWQIAKDYPW